MFRFNLASALLAFSMGVGTLAHAEPAADAAPLGMTLAELQAAYPALQRMAHPVVAPHGLRGQWRLTDTQVAGLAFETTFFFQGQRVQRIEQLRADAAPPCTQQGEFGAVVSATGLQYGAGSAGFAPQGLDAFGTVGDADVSAHLQASAGSCAIRIIYKPTVLRDASTL
ncbi:MAG: hypothetical protein JWP29_3265 [Rhodoferax sp.]|nr:hypothetical protein [Rhodoferax sp.]